MFPSVSNSRSRRSFCSAVSGGLSVAGGNVLVLGSSTASNSVFDISSYLLGVVV